ncbi:MAG: MerR family transcriptional regulator [Anaerovoracaceae bacterium]
MNRKDYYSIGEVASTCNISIRTLRYYDEIGLVVPEIRKEGSKYRYYSKDQMLNIIIIRKLRCLGIGLKDIKSIVEENDLDVMRKSVEERLSCIRKEIAELERSCSEGEVMLRRLKTGSDILELYSENSITSGKAFNEINIEQVPRINIYYSRKMMKAYHNEEVSLERWVGINDEVIKNGLRASGPIIVTYHTELLDQFLSKTCDIEFGIQVEETDSSKVRSFGGFKAATIYHVGAYSDIIKTYVKALQWINQNNYKVSGPVSEEFIVSPIDVKKEGEHVTNILIPVEKG